MSEPMETANEGDSQHESVIRGDGLSELSGSDSEDDIKSGLQTTSASNSRPDSDSESQGSGSAAQASEPSSPGSSGDEDEEDEDEAVDQLLESFLESSTAPPHIERYKNVLKKRGQDYFEVMPEGWIEVTHSSGMPIYLHQASRVCTLSKPYYLGGGSARRHELPISAIPCLQYRRELDKELQAGDQTVPNVALETVKDHKREKWLTAEEVKEYCSRLFEFMDIKVRKFKTWADRRKHNLMLKHAKSRPSLPNDTRLITCSGKGMASSKKEFVMNPAGKSYVCILHEFIQHKEKVQPRYHYKELENATLPYSATAEISGTPYGTGFGKSKKEAKEEAARLTIEILIPGIKDITEALPGDKKQLESSQDLKFFDQIDIEDSRITDLCSRAGLQSPYQILVECFKRNTGNCNSEIGHSVQLVKHLKNIYTMTAGEYEAKVECKNKREGKQKAAQKLLQMMHPQVTSWGGLLLMYGRGSCKTPKEKKEEEQRITELQSAASPNTPNYAILSKLKEEMLKLNY